MAQSEKEMDRIFRDTYGRVLANLISRFEDFELAEEALSEAYVIALEKWPERGVPDNPGGWLTVTARRIALDCLRRESNYRDKLAMLEDDPHHKGYVPGPDVPDTYPDERLKLIFTCCHPALSREAQVALTLRALGGLTTGEIADAFLIKKSAMAQRLVRAKRKIKESGIPFRVPPAPRLSERLDEVLAVIYLIFNEGYLASSGGQLMREDLTREAIRLGRTLVYLLEQEDHQSSLPEALGLLALMHLHHARSPARVDHDGSLITLADQDRSRWDPSLIASGQELLERALSAGKPGPFQIQAAISALHAEAPSAHETDWVQIALLYDRLYVLNPSPVVRLNQAVAVSKAASSQTAWEIIEGIEQDDELEGYAPYHIVRAYLLRQRGDLAAAARAYQKAAGLTENDIERRHLQAEAEQLINAGQLENEEPHG